MIPFQFKKRSYSNSFEDSQPLKSKRTTSHQENDTTAKKLIFEGCNEKLYLHLDQDVRLLEIAKIFAFIAGIPLDQIKLSNRGKLLSLDATAQSYQFNDMDVINVIPLAFSSIIQGTNSLLNALDYKLSLLRKRPQVVVFLFSPKLKWIVVLSVNKNETLDKLMVRYKQITNISMTPFRIWSDSKSQEIAENCSLQIQNLATTDSIVLEVLEKPHEGASAPASFSNETTEQNGTVDNNIPTSQESNQNSSTNHQYPNTQLQETTLSDINSKELSTEISEDRSFPVVERSQENSITETVANEKNEDPDLLMDKDEPAPGEQRTLELLSEPSKLSNDPLGKSPKLTSQSNKDKESTTTGVLDITEQYKALNESFQEAPTIEVGQSKSSEQASSTIDDSTELPPGNQQSIEAEPHPLSTVLPDQSQLPQETVPSPKAQESPKLQLNNIPSGKTPNGTSQIPVIDVDDPLSYKFHFIGPKDWDVSIYEDQTFQSFFKEYKEKNGAQKDLSFRFNNKLIDMKDTPFKIKALLDATNTIEVIQTEPELVTFVLQDVENKYRPLYFKAKYKTRLKKAFSVYGTKNALNPERLCFKFKDKVLKRNDTAISIGLENGSTVYVYV